MVVGLLGGGMELDFCFLIDVFCVSRFVLFVFGDFWDG